MDRIDQEMTARRWLVASLRWSATLDRCRADHEARGRMLTLERRDVEAADTPETAERPTRVA
jgi:hypothetical protein